MNFTDIFDICRPWSGTGQAQMRIRAVSISSYDRVSFCFSFGRPCRFPPGTEPIAPQMLHGQLAKDRYAHQLHGPFIGTSLFLKQHLELRRDFFFLRWAPALSDRSAHMFRQFCLPLRQGRTNPFTIRPESVSGYPLRPVWRPPLLLFQPLPKSSGAQQALLMFPNRCFK